jgi:hypothetical protein
MAGDEQVARRRFVRLGQHGQVPAARHAGHDEHGVRHGGDADEGQDHLLQRAERRTAPSVSGRTKPTPAILDDPTYAGYSTGHWEGDTLVVETVSLRDKPYIEGFSPHSDQMTVKERSASSRRVCSRTALPSTDPKAL